MQKKRVRFDLVVLAHSVATLPWWLRHRGLQNNEKIAPAETRIMRKSDWTEGANAPWRSQSKIARLKNCKITVGTLCVV